MLSARPGLVESDRSHRLDGVDLTTLYQSADLLLEMTRLTEDERALIGDLTADLLRDAEFFTIVSAGLHGITPGSADDSSYDPRSYLLSNSSGSYPHCLEERVLKNLEPGLSQGLTLGMLPNENVFQIFPYPEDPGKVVVHCYCKAPHTASGLSNNPGLSRFTIILPSDSDVVEFLERGSSAPLLPFVLRDAIIRMDPAAAVFVDAPLQGSGLLDEAPNPCTVIDYRDATINRFDNTSSLQLRAAPHRSEGSAADFMARIEPMLSVFGADDFVLINTLPTISPVARDTLLGGFPYRNLAEAFDPVMEDPWRVIAGLLRQLWAALPSLKRS